MQGGRKDAAGFNRRGAMKKFRGRLNIELSIQKGSAFSVLVINIKVGQTVSPSPHSPS